MINQEGFLSRDITRIEKDIELEYSFALEKIKLYNIFFQETALKIKAHKNEPLHWCLTALYIRALSTYQSIIILLKKGITNEANVLLRGLFEIQYIIISLCKFPALVNEYLGQEVLEMKKILKNSRKWSNELLKEISLKEVEGKIKEIEEEIDIHKLKKYLVKDFAQRADLLLDYEVTYAILCLASHSNIYDIKKHLVFDENGIISSFSWGPNKNNIKTVLAMATETMFRALSPLRDVFSLNIEQTYNEYLNDFVELRPKLKSHNGEK